MDVLVCFVSSLNGNLDVLQGFKLTEKNTLLSELGKRLVQTLWAHLIYSLINTLVKQ